MVSGAESTAASTSFFASVLVLAFVARAAPRPGIIVPGGVDGVAVVVGGMTDVSIMCALASFLDARFFLGGRGGMPASRTLRSAVKL